MKLLSLDPSSTCTGYAVLTAPDQLVDLGRIRPKVRDENLDRIDEMVRDVGDLIAEHEPDHIVIEVTSGKVAGRLGRAQGLGVYGMAVGAIRQCCIEMVDSVTSVTENEWTRGVPKKKRQALLPHLCPEYKNIVAKDRGGDVADAIGLALWWFDRRNEREALAC